MKTMPTSTRRQFLRHTALAAGACAAFPAITYAQAGSANDTIRIAIVGVRNKGKVSVNEIVMFSACNRLHYH